ncbi:MAG: YwmB family TATA-box binding protein [Thermanaeromonas sp.]|uniref:YwmB family TATA-box binding protein n=1 Tax=Thermanaeromonas sp. TaxID=2003697 RepID=UPI00243ABF4D|nr:YwmB family TATA-box binding protein [Thermanaeromonas sp.]MCG0278553.1 YwmB family TATA-box binding protein [Thermanaeromonas sp.]
MGIFGKETRRARYVLILSLVLILILGGLSIFKLYADPRAKSASVNEVAREGAAPGAVTHVPPLLERALKSVGAQGESVRLEAWGVLSSTFVEIEELARKAGEAAEDLKLRSDFPWKEENQPGFRSVSWEGEVEPGVVLYLSVQSLKDLSGKGETYLLLSWEGSIGERGIAELLQQWQEQAVKVFQRSAAEPRFTYLVIGRIPGYLSLEERKQRVQTVLSAFEATKIEGLEEEELVSITAYSPLLPQKVEVAGQKANLNVALRFHSTDNTTYLYLGSPLLGGEY